MERPRFISLEGGEGVGKSTQIARLAERLRTRGETVVVTREPGGTPLGESIRHLLQHAPEGRGMRAETELLLFLASRAELVRTVIEPALAAGSWVLADRFDDSTRVYQGRGRGLALATVEAANAVATGGCQPGLTLLLDLDAAEAAERLRGRRGEDGEPDRLEAESDDFHAQVRAGFLELAQAEPERFRVIRAAQAADAVAEAIWGTVAQAFASGPYAL